MVKSCNFRVQGDQRAKICDWLTNPNRSLFLVSKRCSSDSTLIFKSILKCRIKWRKPLPKLLKIQQALSPASAVVRKSKKCKKIVKSEEKLSSRNWKFRDEHLIIENQCQSDCATYFISSLRFVDIEIW